MAKKERMGYSETLELVAEKLDQLEQSLKNNIPKQAILTVVRNLKRTAQEQIDYTYRNF